jgi:hypothetical protein
VRQKTRGHGGAVHIVGHGVGNVRVARQLAEGGKRADFALGQADGLFAGQANGDGLARARTDQRETLEIGGLEGQSAGVVFQKHGGMNRSALDHGRVGGGIGGRDVELRFAIEIAELLHLDKHSSRGPGNCVFRDNASSEKLLQVGLRLGLRRLRVRFFRQAERRQGRPFVRRRRRRISVHEERGARK